MKKAPFDQAKADACQIVKPAFALAAEDIKTEVLRSRRPPRSWSI